jgi:hypothetical protein
MRALTLLSLSVWLSACEMPQSREALAGPTRPFGGTPHPIPGRIEAEDFDQGAPGEAYFDIDEKNHGADYRGATQVDIEKRPDASGGHGIGWTRKGEWLLYTVQVLKAGTYTVEFPVASQKKGGTFHLEINGKPITEAIRVPDTGGWKTLEIIRTYQIHLKAGTHLLKMVMDTEGPSKNIGDIDYLQFVRIGP